MSALASIGLSHLTPGIGRLSNTLVMKEGKGCWVTDDGGKKYLDFTSGIGVTSTGHCHPKVVRAAQQQMEKIVHAQVNIGMHEPMIRLIEKLLPIVPKGLDKFFFWNSGAEAVEAAVKLARMATKKKNIITFKGGYHGRTFGTMGLTSSKTIYSEGFGPFVPGVYTTPYPYCLHCPTRIFSEKSGTPLGTGQESTRYYTGKHKECVTCCNQPLRDLERLFVEQTSPSDTAAVLLEPFQGEGGYLIPPPDFLPGVKEICARHNVLLIADEVQTGFGRTGKWFAMDHSQTVPDILVMAKGIASGFPLSGIAAKAELMDTQPPGSMGGTYSGNAVACAAALATLEVFEEEKILSNVNLMGEKLMNGLRQLKQKHSQILDVRGKGLMVGVEFDSSLKGFASKVSKSCFAKGMLLLTTGSYETVRFIPPLNVKADEVELALTTFGAAVQECVDQLQ